jgi:hypothetical protein
VFSSLTFAAGEEAFADNAFLVSGGARSTCTAVGIPGIATIKEALTGSDLSDCVNVAGGGAAVLEVSFVDNLIVNGPGPDLVVFELSGPLSAGTPDPRERFRISVFDGASFSAFADVVPVATGINSFGDPSTFLDIFAVEVDLTSFGLAPGAATDRVRLNIFDVGQGTKGADIAALGAVNSAPIPEPHAAILFCIGALLVGGAARKTTHRAMGGSWGSPGRCDAARDVGGRAGPSRY